MNRLPAAPCFFEPDMNEDQVKRIASDFVAHLELDPFKFESVQRLSRLQPSGPSTTGGEWVVRFAIEQDVRHRPRRADNRSGAGRFERVAQANTSSPTVTFPVADSQAPGASVDNSV